MACDQGGNVWEWNEAILYGSYRGLRGGSFYNFDNDLNASIRNYRYYYPTNENIHVGFRVSEVPEPGSMALLALGAVGMLRRRRNVRG
jgi:formylglycine-generating enzyme required for sulfatase activity